MMKRLIFTGILALSLLTGIAQERYSKVKLFADRNQLGMLAAQGLYIDHGIFRADEYVICELSQNDLAIAMQAGIRYEVLISDMTQYYMERNAGALENLDEFKRMEYALSRDWPVPEGFELGTCGGFLTIDQCMQHLDAMADQYPDLISPRATLDYQTHNNRSIYWVRLSDNPNTDEDEIEVLYTGMHHAREPIGMQLLVYYMYYLLENYDTDPDVQYIVNNFELYFVPIINMDGYAYNIQNYPGGGGQWRKNRRQNDDGSYGVDINRNYGYMWGYDNNGSSPYPEDDTYRGPSPNSEPETQSLVNFCEQHEFRSALNYHSYSNLLLYPWGWSDIPCPEDEIFHEHSVILTSENGYTYGAGSTTIYPTNGGSDDWMYGEQSTKNLIFSYTPEVGSGDDGFWPSVSRIIPLCQENMYQNLMVAKLSGPYAIATDMAPTILENTSGLLFFELKRLGLEDGATYTVSIEPLSDALASVSDPFGYSDLEILETASAAFTYTLKPDILSGEEVKYLLSVNNGLATFSDTITKIYGEPVVIFSDSADNFNKWTSPGWNTTTQQYHSAPRSIADSPVGDYDDNENNPMTLSQPIDLSDVVYASLNFWAKWDIEAGYDYVQVLISDNNGSTWNPVGGNYTHPGNSNQQLGEPLYDGTQNTWVKEEISLKDYVDQQIKIRFRLVSDTYITGDGFFWDDMTVTVVDLATGTKDDPLRDAAMAVSVSPNPASDEVSIRFSSQARNNGPVDLQIYDLSGRKVFTSELNKPEGTLTLDVSGWPEGMYFYHVSAGRSVVSSGKIVVK